MMMNASLLYLRRKYNKDAFIIIKNQSRRDLTKSQPFPEGEFKPRHPYEEKK